MFLDFQTNAFFIDTRNLIYFIDRDARNSFYSDVNLNQAKKSSSSSLTTTLKPDNKNTPHDKLFSSSSSLNKQNTLTEMASQAVFFKAIRSFILMLSLLIRMRKPKSLSLKKNCSIL